MNRRVALDVISFACGFPLYWFVLRPAVNALNRWLDRGVAWAKKRLEEVPRG